MKNGESTQTWEVTKKAIFCCWLFHQVFLVESYINVYMSHVTKKHTLLRVDNSGLHKFSKHAMNNKNSNKWNGETQAKISEEDSRVVKSLYLNVQFKFAHNVRKYFQRSRSFETKNCWRLMIKERGRGEIEAFRIDVLSAKSSASSCTMDFILVLPSQHLPMNTYWITSKIVFLKGVKRKFYIQKENVIESY